ncbi:MAG: 16S rRNA (guanine(527)-N(7))-methyltransferase RsmG [Bacteroidota bacterium]|jgi:16S rRNA (guanine527-N7)-methyltransferase|nr:16S rRNA (guanine(527)-N(7))-methyltransferase RsmG [Cytophagales bacterium]MCE2958785.1 16S rRNA (guanine(527)-N(7))-methyltransferase RsmG [Flammeovirgaceae bacterium]MCZ8071346.1 16S rRNA (guanine(527)-N(7))-methyltransferase RsmG [Cytophagales bacterium]
MADASIIQKYFPTLTDQQQKQFSMLGDLYREWNDKINVISRKDVDNLYVNHVLHSLGIAKVMQFRPGASVLDVGTGGGFPGIPLAIMFPETKFHLVDSIGKKITVVKAVAEGAGITNVTAEQIRAEQLKARYHFVVSRAVTRMKEFYGWIHKNIRPDSLHSLDNGILYLKGGDLDEEMNELKRRYSTYDLTEYFQEEFFQTKKVVYVPVFN